MVEMLAEASAGTCDFIKSLAEEMAPEIADHYLLDYPDAATQRLLYMLIFRSARRGRC